MPEARRFRHVGTGEIRCSTGACRPAGKIFTCLLFCCIFYRKGRLSSRCHQLFKRPDSRIGEFTKLGVFRHRGTQRAHAPLVALANFGLKPVLAACGLCHRRRDLGFQTAFDAASTCLFESRSRSALGKQSIFLFAHGDSEAGSRKGKDQTGSASSDLCVFCQI